MAHTNDCPLVSIIIPTFNKADLAIETLKSVLAQSYINWECIIVDDGSKIEEYNTILNFTKTDRRFTIYKRPSNKPKGANACRNYGMLLSKGKYIQFFDSDDLMLGNCIQGRVITIESGELDFVVYCMGLIYGDKKVLDKDLYFVSDWEEALKSFLGSKKLPWNLQRTLFKSVLIKNRIMFNEDMKRFQDIEFHINLLVNCKPKFKMIQEFDCYYRFVSDQNKRTGQFNLDVFQSIPIFLKSINNLIESHQFENYKIVFQERIYVYLSLYTIKSISFSQLKDVLNASKQYIGVTRFQQLILIFLFYGKKYYIISKGKAFYFNLLKKLYL